MPAELLTSAQQGSWEDLLEEYLTCERLKRGQIVTGTVIQVTKDHVLVDIGAKCEGIVSAVDLQELAPEALADVYVGAEVMVYVVTPEDKKGNTVLSLARAQAMRDWQASQQMMENQETIESEVVDHNKGGVLVDVGRLRGFVPGSQLAPAHAIARSSSSAHDDDRWADLMGDVLTLQVIEVDQSRNRLILSERAAIRDLRKSQRDKLFNELTTGEVRQGKVINLADFGAFVDIGGVDGLVHLSELSWQRVEHPSKVLSVGQDVEVYVLNVDRERQRVALSIKRLLSDPWSSAEEKYKPGQLVEGKITRLTKWGAFAQIVGDESIEGLIHISELDDRHIAHPREVVEPKQVVTLRVLSVESARHRLALSLKQVGNGEFIEEDLAAALKAEPADTPESVFPVALTAGPDSPEEERSKNEVA